MATTPTAWGEVILSYGVTGANGAMSATLKDIGAILEDSLSIEKEDGTLLELYSTGHNLFDQLRGEPKLTIRGTVIGISAENATEFWGATTVSGKTKISSMVSSKKYSIKMASKVVGSDALEAPYCSVEFTPLYSEKEGWTAEFAFTIIRYSPTTELFSFSKVTAA